MPVKHKDCKYRYKDFCHFCDHPDKRLGVWCWDYIFPAHAGECPLSEPEPEPKQVRRTCGNCWYIWAYNTGHGYRACRLLTRPRIPGTAPSHFAVYKNNDACAAWKPLEEE